MDLCCSSRYRLNNVELARSTFGSDERDWSILENEEKNSSSARDAFPLPERTKTLENRDLLSFIQDEEKRDHTIIGSAASGGSFEAAGSSLKIGDSWFWSALLVELIKRSTSCGAVAASRLLWRRWETPSRSVEKRCRASRNRFNSDESMGIFGVVDVFDKRLGSTNSIVNSAMRLKQLPVSRRMSAAFDDIDMFPGQNQNERMMRWWKSWTQRMTSGLANDVRPMTRKEISDI